LVRRFDDELGAMLLASHTAALEAVQRGRHRLLGESALTPFESTRQPDELDQGQESDFEIALSVLDQLETEARALARRSNP
jgi:hypothetical protein